MCPLLPPTRASVVKAYYEAYEGDNSGAVSGLLTDDVALPVVFPAFDAARWVTGETIFVSGGAAI